MFLHTRRGQRRGGRLGGCERLRAGAAIQHLLQHIDEHARGGRLGHEAHGARVHRATHARRIVQCRQHHDGQRRKALAQLADERKAADPRQRHIEQHEIEIRIGSRCRESFVGRAGRDDVDTVAEPLQRGRDPLEDQRVIVDDEYFQSHIPREVPCHFPAAVQSRPMRPWSREL